jgi:cytochrome c oxidase assembly protein subunit 15
MRRALNFFAWFVVGATLVLITVGGHVTTKGAGLAVPDWPLSFGEVNPPGWWLMPGVRLEHGHRLVGALIGLLTLGLAGWTFACERDRIARRLSIAAIVAVIVQGVLGGMRVNLISTPLAVAHGCLGQLFLLLLATCAMRLNWLSKMSIQESAGKTEPAPASWALLVLGLPVLVFVQLTVAAIMRHYGAGIAIPDFPLAFGRLIPPLATFPIAIHFAHRVLALMISIWILAIVARAGFRDRTIRMPLAVLLVCLTVQIALGASVVLTGRNPMLTTLHVVNGAIVLLISYMMAARTWACGDVFASASHIDDADSHRMVKEGRTS